jgi:hypothetical protein
LSDFEKIQANMKSATAQFLLVTLVILSLLIFAGYYAYQKAVTRATASLEKIIPELAIIREEAKVTPAEKEKELDKASKATKAFQEKLFARFPVFQVTFRSVPDELNGYALIRKYSEDVVDTESIGSAELLLMESSDWDVEKAHEILAKLSGLVTKAEYFIFLKRTEIIKFSSCPYSDSLLSSTYGTQTLDSSPN